MQFRPRFQFTFRHLSEQTLWLSNHRTKNEQQERWRTKDVIYVVLDTASSNLLKQLSANANSLTFRLCWMNHLKTQWGIHRSGQGLPGRTIPSRGIQQKGRPNLMQRLCPDSAFYFQKGVRDRRMVCAEFTPCQSPLPLLGINPTASEKNSCSPSPLFIAHVLDCVC
jgi:hypothetical protein